METLRGLRLAWRAEAHMEGRPASDSRPRAWVQLWLGDVGDPPGEAAAQRPQDSGCGCSPETLGAPQVWMQPRDMGAPGVAVAQRCSGGPPR